MKTDKFELVRYDINGEVKNDKLKWWEIIICIFVIAVIYPIIVENW